jgi:hypothetical protein
MRLTAKTVEPESIPRSPKHPKGLEPDAWCSSDNSTTTEWCYKQPRTGNGTRAARGQIRVRKVVYSRGC